MIRSQKEASEAFVLAAEIERASLLVRLSYDLTITARDLRNQLGTEAELKLTGISEVQHKALSQALSYMSGSPYRYPAEDFILLLTQTAERFSLANHVQHSISRFFEMANQRPEEIPREPMQDPT